jgi:hypothetical protein
VVKAAGTCWRARSACLPRTDSHALLWDERRAALDGTARQRRRGYTMPMSHLARMATIVALSVGAFTATQASQRGTAPRAPDDRLITASAMGPVKLGMTLDEARRSLPRAMLTRTSDGDGLALVDISFGKDDGVIVYAEEDDPSAPIAWTKKIVTIEAFSATFHTSEGIHPGSLVRDTVPLYGPIHDVVKSEIESREYITFARQPNWLTFRLDYTGIFAQGEQETTRVEPHAKIWSIAISSL